MWNFARGESNDGEEPYRWRSQTTKLESLPTGLYRLRLIPTSADPTRLAREQQHIVSVGKLGVISQVVGDRQSEQLELWLVDMQSGSPIAEASLSVRLAHGRHSQLQWTEHTLTTDAKGIARLPLNVPKIRGVLIRGSVGEEPIVMVHANLRHVNFEGGEQDVAFILTDRPLYRPGESVSFQAFVRQRRPAERSVVIREDQTQIEVRIVAADGSELQKETLDLDANGAIESSFELPDPTALGQYSLQLRWPGDNYYFASEVFQVDEVRLPEFRGARRTGCPRSRHSRR